jgi:hypothetical protein
VSALNKIRRQLPRPVALEFYGNHSYGARAWFDPAWMNEHGNLPEAQLMAELKKCDWGFSPMSLTDEDPRYNRFSLPTKFVSYLRAGLPIIMLGHPESSVMRMAAAYSVGISACTADQPALSAQLLTELARPNPSMRFRDGIRRCVAAEFDTSRMRLRLHECFQKCAQVTHGK